MGRKTTLALATVGLMMAGTAQAEITITEGNDAGGTDNVLFNACLNENPGLNIGPGTNIQGCLNQNHTQLVNISSTDEITGAGQGGGQANLSATDGSFTDLTISMDDGSTFTKAIFNIDVVDSEGDGTVDFTVLVPGEADFTQTFNVDANGQNFFTIIAE